MTITDRGALLGRYEGSWHLLAATAAFPLLALVVGGVQTLGAGSVRGFLGLLALALFAWLVIGIWVLARRATHVAVHEKAVVWKRPMRRARVIALEDIRQVRREGGDTTTAVLLNLRDGSLVALEGFAKASEIASLVQRGLEGPRTSSGWTPPRTVGPEPLVTWLRWVCRGIHGGPIWLDNSPESCQAMLRDYWGITERSRLMESQGRLLSNAPNAWDDLRAINNLLAATRAGLLPEAELWSMIVPICQRLQGRYTSFEAVWLDYLAGFRVWQELPADGSRDEGSSVAQRMISNIEKGRRLAPEVPFDLALSATPAAPAWSPPAASGGGWSPPGGR